MLRKLTTTIAFTLGLAVTTPAQALWIEPYAGYEIGDQEQGNSSYDASGLNLGIKGGGSIAQINLGIDYSLGDFTVEYTNNDEDIKTRDLGLYIGTDLSVLKLWFVYLLDSEGNTEDSGDYEGDGGFKFGLGIKAFGPASLNIEKSLRKWKERDGNRLTQKVELDGVLISLSLPFTF